jgi:hypothetical protein
MDPNRQYYNYHIPTHVAALCECLQLCNSTSVDLALLLSESVLIVDNTCRRSAVVFKLLLEE